MGTQIDDLMPAVSQEVRPRMSLARKVFVGLADAATRAQVTEVIAELGYEAVAVGDGYRLAESLADPILGDDTASRPRAIIINPVLPGCTGFSLLSGLRDLGWSTPVIFIIDGDDLSARRRAWAQGASGVFVAPFDDQELRSFIEMVIDPEVEALAAGTSELDVIEFPEGTNPGVKLG